MQSSWTDPCRPGSSGTGVLVIAEIVEIPRLGWQRGGGVVVIIMVPKEK